MKQVVLQNPKDIRTLETPLPTMQSGWVLAKTICTGICGTDVHSYFGETIFGNHFPFHIGHEICAVVEDIRDSASGLKKGDHIVVNPFFACNACPACYSGQQNNCSNRTTIGLKGFGGFSEYIYIPEDSAYKITSSDYESISLAEPLATVVYGLDKLRLRPGMRVLIQGVGAIGLLFVSLVKDMNVGLVVASDFNDEKVKRAKNLGADVALYLADPADKATMDTLVQTGFDVVIDCTGSIKAMQHTVEQVRFGGQILLFGISKHDDEMHIKPFDLYKKDISMQCSFALNKDSFARAVALLESGRIATEHIIDKTVPVNELEQTLIEIAQGNTCGKVVVKF